MTRSLLALLFVSLMASSSHAQTVTHVPLYTFVDDRPHDQLGVSVSGAGDVNGDGIPDMIVGAYRDSNYGSARVFSGANGQILHTFLGDTESSQFGYSVSGAGDVNSDGFADLIVGAFLDDSTITNSGSARVFSGATGLPLYTYYGDSNSGMFGRSVSGAGDVNGDGFADFIVGAQWADNNGWASGSVRVYSGATGTPLYSYNGNAGDSFGSSVSGAGDVNNDGFADFIVGADSSYDNDGSARVFSGATGNPLFTFVGYSTNGTLGNAVSGIGDINGDGHADLIAGSVFDGTNGAQSGSARVYSGATGLPLYTFLGDSVGDALGRSVCSAGDVDGDGFPDFMIGAPQDDNNGVNSGSVRVVSGATGLQIYNFNGDAAGNQFGMSVSGIGDINGDGYADFIVGAQSDTFGTNDYARVFVSQVVPEPSTFALLGLGSVSLLLFARRRSASR